jgi:hypothetical protein
MNEVELSLLNKAHKPTINRRL